MKHVLLLSAFLAGMLLLNSCKDDKSNPVTPVNTEIPGLVAYFSFDSTFSDASNALGAVNHGCAFDTNRYGGKARALKLNGVNNWVEIPHNALIDSIESASAFTVAAWVNIRAWYQNWNIFNIICQYESTGDNGWEVGFGSKPYNAMGFSPANGKSVDVRIDTLALKRWYHAALAYDKSAGKARFYLNGILIAEKPFAEPLLNTSGEPMYIGFSPFGPDEYSDGLMDELYLFNRALSTDEILNLFQRNK